MLTLQRRKHLKWVSKGNLQTPLQVTNPIQTGLNRKGHLLALAASQFQALTFRNVSVTILAQPSWVVASFSGRFSTHVVAAAATGSSRLAFCNSASEAAKESASFPVIPKSQLILSGAA